MAARPTGGAEKLRRLAIEYGFHVSSERRPGVVVTIPAEISAGFRLRQPGNRMRQRAALFQFGITLPPTAGDLPQLRP